jgi:hypothetical protein
MSCFGIPCDNKGKITIIPSNDLADISDSGTGRITILSVNGVPVTPVPEPPSMALLGAAICIFYMLMSYSTRRSTKQRDASNLLLN